MPGGGEVAVGPLLGQRSGLLEHAATVEHLRNSSEDISHIVKETLVDLGKIRTLAFDVSGIEIKTATSVHQSVLV